MGDLVGVVVPFDVSLYWIVMCSSVISISLTWLIGSRSSPSSAVGCPVSRVKRRRLRNSRLAMRSIVSCIKANSVPTADEPRAGAKHPDMNQIVLRAVLAALLLGSVAVAARADASADVQAKIDAAMAGTKSFVVVTAFPAQAYASTLVYVAPNRSRLTVAVAASTTDVIVVGETSYSSKNGASFRKSDPCPRPGEPVCRGGQHQSRCVAAGRQRGGRDIRGVYYHASLRGGRDHHVHVR